MIFFAPQQPRAQVGWDLIEIHHVGLKGKREIARLLPIRGDQHQSLAGLAVHNTFAGVRDGLDISSPVTLTALGALALLGLWFGVNIR